MNRSVKFRGKWGAGGWVYGSLVLAEGKAWIYTSRNTSFEVEVESVGEFTGLLDKNGKEIFEGDIVKYFTNGQEIVDQVSWIQCFFGVEKYTGMLSSFVPIEVIGNIYENQDLLSE